MPVKIRCSSCEKVLNAPDTARGKVVKCPGCEAKIRVPAEDGDDATPPKKTGVKSTVKKAVKKPSSTEDFLSDLDLGKVEDTNSRVCPKCGYESDLEALECAKCGVEFSTGQLSAKAARRKGMRGPDPAEFYGVAWKDSWEFLMKNKGLAARTGLFWTLFSVISANMWIISAWCTGGPPKFFWGLLATLFGLGTPGWFWYLNGRIIQHTMAREKKLKDVKFDMLLNAALGLKSGAWIYALTFPLVFAPVVGFSIYFADVGEVVREAQKEAKEEMLKNKAKSIDQAKLDATIKERMQTVTTGGLAAGTLLAAFIPSVLIGGLVFPVAQVHLTMKHSWTAWALWPMLAATFRSFGAVLYWWLMALAAFIVYVVAIIIVVVLAAKNAELIVDVLKMFNDGMVWVLEKCGENPNERGFVAYLLVEAYILVVLFVMYGLFNFPFAFPAVFMMRANGLFGYYNRERLGIMTVARKGVPAGFWPRMVAGMADVVIVAAASFAWLLFLAVVELVFVQFEYVPTIGYGDNMYPAIPILFVIGIVAFLVLYFSTTEGAVDQATPGMRGVGLMVVREDGKKVTPGLAIGRFFARLFVSTAIGGIGYMMAAFTPKRQTLHDMITKTNVVWQGDDEASER